MNNIEQTLNTALQEAKPTLVEFYLTTCPHCRRMEPIVAELKEKVGDKANVIQIEGEQNEALADKYHIRVFPTWVLFKDGQECWRDSGEKPYSELRDMIDRFI